MQLLKQLSPRKLVNKTNHELYVTEEYLSLEYVPEVKFPEWTPSYKKNLVTYDQIFKIYLDIETTGLSWSQNHIIMIGVRFSDGFRYIDGIFNDKDEKTILEKFLRFLNQWDGQNCLLIGHNIFAFDLPFIIARCIHHGIEHPFYDAKWKPFEPIEGNEWMNQDIENEEDEINKIPIKKITSASDQFRFKIFRPIRLKGFDIIDTMQQIAIWDKQSSILSGYGLKTSVLELGLRKEERLELSYNQILECYQNDDYKTINKYLQYDLQDTELLADFTLPIVFYQLIIVPNIKFQDLAIASPALKVQKIHKNLLPNIEAEPDEKVEFKGGGVELHQNGIFRNVAKLDVTSLYPSIMLRYGICSKKDPEQKFLGVLNYMREERLRLKALAKQGDKNAEMQQGAMKVLINGSYGFFGTQGYSFNDYEAAALVTAFGRVILKKMQSVIIENNGILIESDTDGVIFHHSDKNSPEIILELINKELPNGIECELEYQNCVLAIPQKKIYTIVKPDGKIITKGAKRGDIPILNEWKINYLKEWMISEDNAEMYHNNLLKEITRGDFSIEKLTVNRKLSNTEFGKRCQEKGIGTIGNIASYYYGIDSNGNSSPSIEGDYHISYYLNQIKEAKQKLIGKADDNKQLILF
jgi:DNA polymerase elongation subunit (family B)